MVQELVGDGVMNRRERAPIEQEGGGSEGFSPIWWRHGRMDQQGENGVVDGVDHAFSFAILLRGVRA